MAAMDDCWTIALLPWKNFVSLPTVEISRFSVSVAVSSGASDSCQSSDGASVSEPCSPECPASPGIPQPMPPLPASLSEETSDNCLLDSDDFDGINYVVLSERNCSQDSISEDSGVYHKDAFLQCDTIHPKDVSDFSKHNLESKDFGDQVNSCDVSSREHIQKDFSETKNWTHNSVTAFKTLDVKEWEKPHIKSNFQFSHNSFSSPGLTISSLTSQTPVAASLFCSQSPTATSSTFSQSTASSQTQSTLVCNWLNCVTEINCPSELVEHIRNVHVDTQKDTETVTCLWKGCKVYNRPSCSLSWLQRHTLTHGGNKPFKCIVDGCGHRFTSQNALERHVNSHFNNVPTSSANKTSRAKDDSPNKLVRRRKVRNRQRFWQAIKREDFFDAGVMEHVKYELMELNAVTQVDIQETPRAVTFQSIVQGRRVEKSGKVTVLLHWLPEQIFPDEWVCESQAAQMSHRTIPVTHLPREALDTLHPSPLPLASRKRKRK
ncbi:zinc finger protein aebp2-like [Limulus polyphemus]|uniref:Zinc finger protein aebp2-like n=1 Tax=Limulus polyphemus TaxID=6850 RepID=A0ABM1BAU1_LIMPO|nr:zinc finger protein aebp2-like [Limulus polyphemus]